MSILHEAPSGDQAREAIDSLRGYVYQIYQSAIAWTDIKEDEFLYLEVAEDFAVVAAEALKAVQVKETASRVTINSDSIISSIESFIKLQRDNPSLNVSFRHLTTSTIGKEQKPEHRIGDLSVLSLWRNLAKAGDLSDLCRILQNSKLSEASKIYIAALSDNELRENFLKKIHFDCGAPSSRFLAEQINSRISTLVRERGGVHSQSKSCTANILFYLLRKSTNKNRDERFVNRAELEELLEAATQIVLNKALFDSQSRLVEQALSTSLSAGSSLSSPQRVKLSPVSEVPLPNALANRKEYIRKLKHSLERFGICWISGAAGMGKTLAARVLANRKKGDWASINLRGKLSDQVSLALSEAATSLSSFSLQGLIIDDLDCRLEASVLDNLNYLLYSANRSDVLLVVTSANPPASEFLFESNLQLGINVTLTEFTEKDIKEILDKIGVNDTSWVRYTHLVSGGGHPQLAIAFIQSMAATGWDSNELETFNSLLTGSSAIDDVRKRTRERLLKDLHSDARRLIERLSLKVGGFGRELAIDLGKVAPQIEDAGIVLDNLTGSWVDQHESDRFNLSPLLSNYAHITLAADELRTIQSSIADSLTKSSSLDLIDMNSALQAAWSSSNNSVMTKLCMAVFVADNDDLEILAIHLSMLTWFGTDVIAYPHDPVISHMFRGAQLLLLNQSDVTPIKLEKSLYCFLKESKNVLNEGTRSSMNLLVYSKLLIQTSKPGLGVNFIHAIGELAQILDNHNAALPSEVLGGIGKLDTDGIIPIGFMFLNQTQQLSKIEELSIVFDYLNNASLELRSKLLSSFDRDDFEIDILVSGAWLSEYKNKTIDSLAHSAVFSSLEKLAITWNHANLAVCCRKFQAIILDEHGNDKESALAVLNEGLATYGQTNSELVRAKARVLYRSEDHEGSLALSKTLIESDAPLNDVEKAFLGRDAAISAEKQGNFEMARRFYLYGSDAAKKTKQLDMTAMYVGLLADAALASWHNDDKITCLQGFIVVLRELNHFSPEETLRTAHCHALTRHVLLWLDQDATGDAHMHANGEETVLNPGCISNPEPHPKIAERFVTPIEIAWYMLAVVENHASLNAGITENLEKYLPNGPVREGLMILNLAKMHRGISQLNANIFIDALKETISCFAFAQANSEGLPGFNIESVTYGLLPLATKEQQDEIRDSTELFVLLYFAMCVLKKETTAIVEMLEKLPVSSGFSIRPIVLERLQSIGPADDYNTDFAQLALAHSKSMSEDTSISPVQFFGFALKVLQIAQKTGHYRLFSENLLPWIKRTWELIWKRQRSLVSYPSAHEASIEAIMGKKGISPQEKVISLLTAILPTLNLSSQNEWKQLLNKLPKE